MRGFVIWLILKVHNVFPKLPPSLATSCENMASYREWVMEKTRKFQIAGADPEGA